MTPNIDWQFPPFDLTEVEENWSERTKRDRVSFPSSHTPAFRKWPRCASDWKWCGQCPDQLIDTENTHPCPNQHEIQVQLPMSAPREPEKTLSVGFRPLPQTTPSNGCAASSATTAADRPTSSRSGASATAWPGATRCRGRVGRCGHRLVFAPVSRRSGPARGSDLRTGCTG